MNVGCGLDTDVDYVCYVKGVEGTGAIGAYQYRVAQGREVLCPENSITLNLRYGCKNYSSLWFLYFLKP